jgi:SHAQKYF class myb-like DNA-binding protein
MNHHATSTAPSYRLSDDAHLVIHDADVDMSLIFSAIQFPYVPQYTSHTLALSTSSTSGARKRSAPEHEQQEGEEEGQEEEEEEEEDSETQTTSTVSVRSGVRPAKKKRATVHLDSHNQQWSPEEQAVFERGLRLHGRGHWKSIADMLGSRTPLQVKNHARVYFRKHERRGLMWSDGQSEFLDSSSGSGSSISTASSPGVSPMMMMMMPYVPQPVYANYATMYHAPEDASLRLAFMI